MRTAFLRSEYGTATERFRLSPTRAPAPSWTIAGRGWGIVTAWNPGARAQDAALNRAAHTRLGIRTAQLRRMDAVNGKGDWQEEAFLLLDISLAETVKLGREFGQAAVLFAVGQRAALVWCEPAPVQVERFWAELHPGEASCCSCIL
ncbi:DUF3293 domain-containing protein [Deinococcus deserti]|uniref:DUF3293 domain-containing protein n=1 Tax=Deinococcus deserti (strain DSM 17065 / CIP 109153 / LMG 22923 / VCD115) TaxID=546414 RepID=C1CW12_DEIDV|nr:DUF3293 domain-containing protein [Deinococcus deserti]ACO46379.1 hypothetical protein Deide_14301 [Deinococcus deserti VCD115]